MKLSYEDHDRVTVIRVSGELTSDQTELFRRTCSDRFESGVKDIVLDVEHMSLIDSAGLELLLWLQEEVARPPRQGHLRLVKPDEVVSRILDITRLNRRFSIHESIESAARSLR
jgi:anti-sigma B factor antagonist